MAENPAGAPAKPKRHYTPRGKRAGRSRATPHSAAEKAFREKRRATALANLKKGAEARKRNEEERQIRELEAMQNRLALVIGDDQALAKARQRPQSIIDYCRENDLPEDIPYHPRYNLLGVPPDRPMQQVESIAFGRGWPSELGGLGGYGHLKNFVQMTWPDIEFNPWLEMCFRSLTDDEYATRVGEVTMRCVSWTGPGSAGKAQPLDAIVYTPTGPKPMGAIKVGDSVCVPRGGCARVQNIFPQGELEIYKITFADGSSTRCCEDHLWKVVDREAVKVVNTRWLLENYRRVGKDGRVRREIAVNFPASVFFETRHTALPPYLLGALIANGMLGGKCGSAKRLDFSSDDHETVERVRWQIGQDHKLTQHRASWDYTIARTEKIEPNRIIVALKGHGLWGKLAHQKFIPCEYLHNSEAVRFEVLRGLMDCDGGVERGVPKYYTTSKELADDVQWLVRSLGGTASISVKHPQFTYRGQRKQGRDCYVLQIRIKEAWRLFHLPRKRHAVKEKERKSK